MGRKQDKKTGLKTISVSNPLLLCDCSVRTLCLLSGSLCLSGGSLSGILCCLGCLLCCLCSSQLGTLLSYCLSLSLVLLGLLFKSLLSGGLLAFALLVLHCLELSGLLSLPSIETTLCLSLVKGTLLDTALQMLHQHHAFTAQNVANSLGGLCADVNPIQCAIEI